MRYFGTDIFIVDDLVADMNKKHINATDTTHS